MKIIQAPSPNLNARKWPLDMLVLHYTGMQTGDAALSRMCDPEAQVSAHYMIWEDGQVVQLVPETERAWHAGVSSCQGEGDLNSRSIGIEIVNGGHDWPSADGTLPPYPDVQISSVIALCQDIIQRWSIPQRRIVGHSDIAPERKDDPGEHFPWRRLAAAGIGLWPAEEPDLEQGPGLIGRGLGLTDQGEAVSRLQTRLQAIGYAVTDTAIFESVTEAVVRAFQRRWVPDRVSGQADLLTLQRVEQVSELYKTT